MKGTGKRVLALMLSVAMVATSGNLSMDVYAMGNLADMSSAAIGSVGDGSDKTQSDSSVEVTTAGDLIDGADMVEGNAVSDGVQTFAADSTGTGDADDPTIIDQNDYFVVIGVKNGKLQLKKGVSVESLSGTVVLPSKTKWIPAGIFTKNEKITGITIPEDNQIERIDAEAFAGSAITSFEVPDGVKQIEKGTFKNSKLNDITFGSQLETIGEEAFMNCGMTSVSIPASVKEIGDHAFDSCGSLRSLQLSAVEVLGDSAFKNCRDLSVIGWSKNLKEIRSSAFYGCISLTVITKDVELGAKVTTWGSSVFEGCSSLTSVVLHDDMNQIPAGMFKNCTKLTTVTIPKTCGVIRQEAFSGCVALKKITIPAKVSAIEADAFADCQGLTEVTIEQKGASGESDIILSEDAFPTKSGVTMKGYDGTVEDYATRKKYTFKTLFTSNKITVKVNKSASGKAELSKTKAREGDIIEVKITPATGYRLKASTFRYNDTNITDLKEEADGVQVFTFVMPDEDVEVIVDFELATTSYGTLSAAFDQIDQMTYDWDKKKNTLTFDKTGLACRLVVQGKTIANSPGVWMFEYKSSNSKIASIDSKGVIYAKGKGTATITAKLKEGINNSSTEVSFKVKVLETAEIDHYSLTFSDLDRAKSNVEEIAGENVWVIRYTKDNLTKEEKSFKVGLLATSGVETTNLFVRSSWESANTDMVTVDNETVDNNSNVIRVLKGVTGETAVTVTVTNNKSGKDKVTFYEESFIIRVIDATPRLVQSTLTVNSKSSTGTEFDLLSVYGYEVDPATVMVVEKVKNGKITDYEVTEKAGYVSVRYTDGKYHLDMTNNGKNFIDGKSNKSYSNMYLQGEYHYRNDSGATMVETFRTPIKSLVLTCKDLKPTVKCSGKINLFFNRQAAVSERGQVTLTQSLKNLNVTKYELISEEHFKNPEAYEKAEGAAVDALANNFDITGEGVISRSGNELIKDAKGKAIVKGYVRITYEGYEPCYAKITIPTNTTKPGYVLSKTKATVNTYGSGYRMELQLLDKKTKKPLSLEKLRRLSFDESSSGTTFGLFENMNTEDAKASDKITLQIKTAQKGKAVINVEMDTWNDPMKFTFNLSVTEKIPTVKAKPTTLTLNNLCVGREAQTVLTLNQADSTLTDMGIAEREYVGKASLASDAAKINFTYANGVLSAKASGEMQAGSYKFRFTPKVTYANGESDPIKPITLTIKVIDTKLTATLKPSSVTLNDQFRGKETGVYKYTIKNMPTGDSVQLWTNDGDDAVSITGVNQSAESVKSAFDFSYGETDQSITVKQNKAVRKGSYKYQISGLKAEVEGKPVEIQPFKITVKVINTKATLTAKAKGTLSIGNSNSSIVYTLKLGNYNTKIENITFTELDTSNKLNSPYEGEDLTNFTTEVLRKEDGSVESFVVRAKPGVILDAKRTYKFRVNLVEYDETTGQNIIIVPSKELSVKPKQTVPKVKTDVTSATFYAGVALNSPQRSQEILITPADTSAEISYVTFADSNPDNLKKAFRVQFNQETQKAKLTLVRPDLLKPDTVYSLKLETRYRGQMDHTKGTQFNVNVKVLN